MKMKKLIAFLILIFTISISFAQSLVPDDGPTCSCPAQSTCNATCTLSDCCICWDPNTSEGACGCYFGIASCKSSKKPKTPAITGSPAVRKVVFKFEAFNKFLNFLETSKIDYQQIQPIYKRLSEKYNNPSGNVQIDPEDMDIFYDAYFKIMQSLSASDKIAVTDYLKSH